MTDPCELSAVEAADQMRAGRLTAEALVLSCLDRIGELEPTVHAWVEVDRELALAGARAADRSPTRGPLHGVPFGVKDIMATHDLPTAYGSAIYASSRPTYDAAMVALARRAGGVLLGKTVTTEFAYARPGPTRNPRNVGHSPGGSSSGSAAAVAAGMVPLATGTQTGGSVVRPAAYCGVVGIKPSFGLVEVAGTKALATTLDTLGTMGRSVADAAMFLDAVAGTQLSAVARAAERPARIGICRSPSWPAASTAMQAAFEALPARLSAVGATVVETELPIEASIVDSSVRIMQYEANHALAYEASAHWDRLSPQLGELLAQGALISREVYERDLRHRAEFRAGLEVVFGNVDVLLTPSAPGSAPAFDLGSTGDPIFNRLWTMAGAPCVTVPDVLPDDGGLPLGVQAVAAPGRDDAAVGAAAWLHANLAA